MLGDANRQIVRGSVLVWNEDGDLVPVIPGSGLKGVVRSLAEALLGGGSPFDDAEVATSAVGCLFGYVDRDAYAGRVAFEDALPDEGAADRVGITRLPVAFPPRVSRGRRIYGPPRQLGPATVPYEVTAAGVRFRTQLHFVNLTEPELGLVLLCLGIDGTFEIRVGGGKFAGLGRVRVEVGGARKRQSYREPRAERLDASQAGTWATALLSTPLLSPSATEQLAIIRRTLGRERRT